MSELSCDPKWLPASPHRERVLAYLADGRAHVVERGHGVAPLLVFEDGGAMELPRARVAPTERGMELVAAEAPDAPDQTKHRDVCGTLDELKSRIAADPARAAAERDELCRLARDAQHMLGRLERRRKAYEALAVTLGELAEALAETTGPDPAPGSAAAEALVERLAAASEPSLRGDREALFALAESVRDLANAQERCLARYRDLAMQLGGLYEAVRGGRRWSPHAP